MLVNYNFLFLAQNMTNEELKKQLDFALEQHALLASKVEQLTESLFALKDIAVANANSLEKLTNLLERMVTIQEKTDNNVSFLAKFQETTNSEVLQLVQAHVQTEEKLNIFIGFFEKYISEIQGFNSPS